MARKRKRRPRRDGEAGEPNLENVDHKIRINELRHRIEELGGNMAVSERSPNLPADVEEKFLEGIVAYETAPLTTGFKQLVKGGAVLPPADQMDDATLSEKLAELIERLARRRVFISNTDHLSDRELYEKLWSEGLREERPDLPVSSNGMWGIDMLGTGSDEDIDLYMTYFADEDHRLRWMKQFPDYKMPAHVDPPYDRDRHLPKCEL